MSEPAFLGNVMYISTFDKMLASNTVKMDLDASRSVQPTVKVKR